MRKAILSPNEHKLYPCNVTAVLIKSGDCVSRGDILFAFKTTDGRKRLSIRAPFEGVVEFLEGKFSGYGKLYKDTGFLRYRGNFENGEFHGFGVLYSLGGGTVRVGQFIDGKLSDDNGEIYFKSGAACKGMMIDGILFDGSGFTRGGFPGACYRKDNGRISIVRQDEYCELHYSRGEREQCISDFWRFSLYPRRSWRDFHFPIDYARDREK